ncbi:uncharacterized protein EKO05_0008060 [Ascochyta rabiei]|uniref:uncharacterized protein n=1 Tax=Didymella rabiei TaxID=5454 RepID=UPI002204D88A|nr:uncharacterized protein EKO05_0008060 [Ascochyta rabiei]UPX17720.1 hypothetical protein EKO05_0008060 [Ascochyta rabiei]
MMTMSSRVDLDRLTEHRNCYPQYPFESSLHLLQPSSLVCIASDDGALIRRVDWSPEPTVPDDLHKSVPPKPAPAKSAKPASGIPVRPAPAWPGKPAQPPAQATPKISPAPAGKPVVWPAVKILYVTTAFDTCGIFVDCDEPGVDVERLGARAVTITHAAHAAPTPAHTPALVRRDVRTCTASAAKVTIKHLDYPSAPDLLQGPMAQRSGTMFLITSPTSSWITK